MRRAQGRFSLALREGLLVYSVPQIITSTAPPATHSGTDQSLQPGPPVRAEGAQEPNGCVLGPGPWVSHPSRGLGDPGHAPFSFRASVDSVTTQEKEGLSSGTAKGPSWPEGRGVWAGKRRQPLPIRQVQTRRRGGAVAQANPAHQPQVPEPQALFPFLPLPHPTPNTPPKQTKREPQVRESAPSLPGCPTAPEGPGRALTKTPKRSGHLGSTCPCARNNRLPEPSRPTPLRQGSPSDFTDRRGSWRGTGAPQWRTPAVSPSRPDPLPLELG